MKFKKTLLSGLFLLAFGFGLVLSPPAVDNAYAAECSPPACTEFAASCSECGGNPCIRFWTRTQYGSGHVKTGCCGDITGFFCG